MEATVEELTLIPDIGEIIAKCIVEYFGKRKNKDLIEKLKELGINTLYTGELIQETEEFQNKTFVITGSLVKYTRDEVEEKISLLGGKCTSSVSKKTSAVIVGENPGSKYDKARNLGIPIWSEDDIEELFKKYE